MRSLGQRPVTGSDEDPRVTELRGAVARLRRELAALRADFPDRAIAEEELAALAAMAAEGSPEIPRLRGCLLLVAGAIGSMSALARPLREVRDAVDLFGQTAHRAQGSPSGGPASRPGDRHGPAAAGRSSDAPR
ncbi:hypothetical protein SAMN04490357_6156 [Streptomyces misionensis]|uniref:Uncharacterized protein n=1 Tax=Streptomyces misionensis TaxID=67331 RepID=A0A1H5E9P6_9ACTN|nr:hypothetical protein SAMN04490357_6156 [Streptomyces misionensis]